MQLNPYVRAAGSSLKSFNLPALDGLKYNMDVKAGMQHELIYFHKVLCLHCKLIVTGDVTAHIAGDRRRMDYNPLSDDEINGVLTELRGMARDEPVFDSSEARSPVEGLEIYKGMPSG